MKKFIYIVLHSIMYCFVVFLSNSYPLPNNIYLVVGDKVNVREEANHNSKILCQLQILHHVQVLKRSVNEVNINGISGRWVYIDTCYVKPNSSSETYKGWVFDYFLSDLKNFKPISSFKKTKIIFGSGDVSQSYYFNKDATFNCTIIDSYENKQFPHKGNLYQYLNVIYAKYDDVEDSGGFFYLNSIGKLCSEFCCEDSDKCFP